SGSVPSLDQRPSGCPFHPRCSWVMEICKTQNPQLRQLDNQRQVSCHLEPESL
ncbi:MAG TPA: oligopeptide ABC transporter ATP-binding protein OppF, partial [Nitrospinaceae bacterium]|nr:oligopeptide ABC transporter ATP-binding protein OppF [Nitrospinaceae bacterium]